jgi:hypothetical protein
VEKMHGHQRVPCLEADNHRKDVISMSKIFNVSDHDFLFTQKEPEIVIADEATINRMIQNNMDRLRTESEATEVMLRNTNSNAKAFELVVPVKPVLQKIEPIPLPYDAPHNSTPIIDLEPSSFGGRFDLSLGDIIDLSNSSASNYFDAPEVMESTRYDGVDIVDVVDEDDIQMLSQDLERSTLKI